jgi:hypothetical protein
MRWLVPSLSDCLLIAVVLWLLLFTAAQTPVGLLQDASTCTHIRTGEYILDHHAVPHTDLFSFSKPGEQWFAWEWLSDVGLAAVYRAWGLKGVMVSAAMLIGLSCWILLQHMLWRGANALVAIGLLNVGIAVSSVHYIARPHIFTLVFLVASLWLIDRDRREPTALVWALVPLTALWVNLHGGFVALIVTLGVLAAGNIFEGNWAGARRYAMLGAGCAAASLCNPFGYQLHLHMFKYLRADWIRGIVEEFQPPRFDSTAGRDFEILLFLGIATAAWLLYKKQIASALIILAWAHAFLMSVRHAPIFAMVVLPFAAEELTLAWQKWCEGMKGKDLPVILYRIGADHLKAFRRMSVAVPLFGVALLVFDFGIAWPTDFPAIKFPVEFVNRHGADLAGKRLFTTDAWGDYLIYRNYPNQRVFLDGRTDYYGPELSHEYASLLNGEAGWEAMAAKYRLELAMVPEGSGLASLLKKNAHWSTVDVKGDVGLYRHLD